MKAISRGINSSAGRLPGIICFNILPLHSCEINYQGMKIYRGALHSVTTHPTSVYWLLLYKILITVLRLMQIL